MSMGPKKPTPGAASVAADSVKKAVADFEKGFQEPTPQIAPPKAYRQEDLKEGENYTGPDKLSAVSRSVDMPSPAEKLGRKAGKVKIEAQKRLRSVNRTRIEKKRKIQKAVSKRRSKLDRDINTGKRQVRLKDAKNVGEKIGFGMYFASDATKEIKRNVKEKRDNTRNKIQKKFDQFNQSEVGQTFNKEVEQAKDFARDIDTGRGKENASIQDGDTLGKKIGIVSRKASDAVERIGEPIAERTQEVRGSIAAAIPKKTSDAVDIVDMVTSLASKTFVTAFAAKNAAAKNAQKLVKESPSEVKKETHSPFKSKLNR